MMAKSFTFTYLIGYRIWSKCPMAKPLAFDTLNCQTRIALRVIAASTGLRIGKLTQLRGLIAMTRTRCGLTWSLLIGDAENRIA